MKFQIPFAVSPLDKLKKRSEFFKKFVKPKRTSMLKQSLESSDIPITREDYLAICLRGLLFSFVGVFVISSTLLFFLQVKSVILMALGLSVVLSSFVFFLRIMYPNVYGMRRQKDIESNLIPALGDMLVQLNSGVPLYTILINISSEDYGSLSDEFKKAVKKISAGLPQADVLEELGEKNSSLFFRRALWQISNGMRAGSDISIVIKSSINSLNDEQLIQIQNYGNKLNPMIMFYMLASVILPALSITFLTVIASLISLPTQTATLIFIFLFIFVVFLQIMFLGVIRSLRPSLL